MLPSADIALKNQFTLIGIDSRAVVAYIDPQLIPFQHHSDLDSLPSVVDRILDQIAGYLPEFDLILHHHHFAGWRQYFQENPVAGENLANHLRVVVFKGPITTSALGGFQGIEQGCTQGLYRPELAANETARF
jgi:hypothetical protein